MIDERKKSDLYNLISCVNLIGSVDLGGGGGGGWSGGAMVLGKLPVPGRQFGVQ